MSLPPVSSKHLFFGASIPVAPKASPHDASPLAQPVLGQQALQHGDSVHFSGKRLEELKKQRADQANTKKILDSNLSIQMNGFILDQFKADDDNHPNKDAIDLSKQEQKVYQALRDHPDYAINDLKTSYINNGTQTGQAVHWTLLHEASFHGLPTVVKLILDERNPDVLKKDSDGFTPLERAQGKGDVNVDFWSEDRIDRQYAIQDMLEAATESSSKAPSRPAGTGTASTEQAPSQQVTAKSRRKATADINQLSQAYEKDRQKENAAKAAQPTNKKKGKKLSPAARQLIKDEKKAKSEKQAELDARFKDLTGNTPDEEKAKEPETEDMSGTWEMSKASRSRKKSGSESPEQPRKPNTSNNTNSVTSRNARGPKKKRTPGTGTPQTQPSSPTLSKQTPSSPKRWENAKIPEKNIWEERKNAAMPPQISESPTEELSRTVTRETLPESTSMENSTLFSPDGSRLSMDDVSRALGRVTTATSTSMQSVSSAADRERIKKLKAQRDEKQSLLNASSRYNSGLQQQANVLQRQLAGKDKQMRKLRKEFDQLKFHYLALRQMPPTAFIQPAMPVPGNQWSQALPFAQQGTTLDNMQYLQMQMQQLQTAETEQEIQAVADQPTFTELYQPDPSGTGYIQQVGSRKGEWFLEIPKTSLPAHPPVKREA
jgi:hypothetical protein